MNVVFNVATVERRKESFKKVLSDLASQTVPCNKINIAFSYGYDREIRKYLDDNFENSGVIYGKFSCEKKFFAFDETDDDTYFLTVDDDINYAPDYAERMIDGIERHQRKAVVGFHGQSFKRFPVIHYRRERTLYQYFNLLGVDIKVHVLGTGVCGFHVSTLRSKGFCSEHLSQTRNMTDDVVAAFCRKNDVDLIVLKHDADWLSVIPGTQDELCTWKRDLVSGYAEHLKWLNT